MKDLKCSVHGTELVEKEVPVFYGMPTPDSDIFEIGSRLPHHGLWSMSLGGCIISPDSTENRVPGLLSAVSLEDIVAFL